MNNNADALVIWEEGEQTQPLPETLARLYRPGATKYVVLVHDMSQSAPIWVNDLVGDGTTPRLHEIDNRSISRASAELTAFFTANPATNITLAGAWYQGRREVCVLHTALRRSTPVGFVGMPSTFNEANWWSSERGVISVATELAKSAYYSFAYQIPFSGCWSGDFPFGLVTFYAGVAFLLSGLLVAALRSFTIRRKMLDFANERSLHKIPTPRGGGVVISTLSLLMLMAIALNFSDLPAPLLIAYVAMAVLLTGISLYDDWIKAVPTKIRLLLHLIAALVIVLTTFTLRPAEIALPIPGVTVVLLSGILAFGLLVVWITGFTNMFNFMDGADGIAGLHTLLAGTGWSVLFLLEGETSLTLISLLIAATSAGFLVHNTSPARIFMGDSGSVFLGFTLASLPVLGFVGTVNPDIFVVGAMFVLPFVVDATYTIIKRWRNGENVLEAHRKHLYQRLVLRGHSHGGVTGLYGLMTVICVVSGILYYTGDALARAVALGVVITMLVTYVISTEYALIKKPYLYSPKRNPVETTIAMTGPVSGSQD
ncbi:MAG: glycosyltransferase family 4 protein [Anaerolinea sp.]|nr:glycosyltransferase family 4 protein [Anaerolinea sp.]